MIPIQKVPYPKNLTQLVSLSSPFLNDIITEIATNFDQLFRFFSRIDYSDLSNIAPEHYTKHMMTHRLAEIKAVESPADRSAFIMVLESSYRFTLGSFAGGKLGLVV